MLVTSELSASADALRRAAGTVRSRIDDTAATRTSISNAGLAGEAADAGLDKLADLGRALSNPADTMEKIAEILEEAAVAQHMVDVSKESLAAAFVPVHLRVAHESTLAALSVLERLLDKSCSASISQECKLEHEQDLDRLVFHPDEPLSQISARLLETAPASVQDVVADADGIVLEGGPDGYSVMIGVEYDENGEPIPPQSVTTVVSGVGSGEPEKFALAMEEAQAVAEATGGAVVVWQGYSAPPTLIEGMSRIPASAGADDLAAFQYAMEERFPDSRKIVVGHSYGSVVAARAAEEYGLFADELYIVGTPGVSASHVDDLTLFTDDPKVTVADSPTDPILLLRSPFSALHGTNPGTARFGAERVLGIRGGHTDYYEDEAFLRALGESARG